MKGFALTKSRVLIGSVFGEKFLSLKHMNSTENFTESYISIMDSQR